MKTQLKPFPSSIEEGNTPKQTFNPKKNNHWKWTELAESLYPDRKAGTQVPYGYLTEGFTEYYPYPSWIRKGYVERVVISKEEKLNA